MNLLSEFDVAVLQAARRVLDDLTAAAKNAVAGDTDVEDGRRLGQLLQQADQTEWALFQVLNVAASNLHDQRAAQALEVPGAGELEHRKAELRRLLCPAALDAGRATRDATVIPVGRLTPAGPRAVA